MRKLDTIWVRNNGNDRLESRYDGEEVVIRPGESVEMEVDCAKLIFGFGEEDKTRAIGRLGWGQLGKDAAIQKLDSFSFHMEKEDGCVSAPADSEAPATPQGETGAVTITRKPNKYDARRSAG